MDCRGGGVRVRPSRPSEPSSLEEGGKQNAGVTPSARVGDGSGPSVLVLEITVDESPAGFLPDDG